MRIAVVHDLDSVQKEIQKIILNLPHHEIAWTARAGTEAMNRSSRDLPDLILMKLALPDISGVEVTRRIMEKSPCAILLITHQVEDHTSEIFEAMSHGALDVVHLPCFGSNGATETIDPAQTRTLIHKKIQTVEKLKQNHIAVRVCKAASPRPPLVVIGSSAGGPKALADILSRLPETLEATLVVIQHVDKEFSAGFVDWLDAQCSLRVKLAVEGGRPAAGVVHVAGTDDHLILTPDYTFSYIPGESDSPYHPSVDVFFKSLVGYCPARPGPTPYRRIGCVGVLLTGMGRDGAEGLLTLYRAGWHTIAQDESTSVIYGMPRAAKEIGAATEVLPIDKIAPAILKALSATA
ncbi:MAG: chemotaxis-specific protein-glutamate methyltransferase CheB [Thermodesulfobacteriota bacterium]